MSRHMIVAVALVIAAFAPLAATFAAEMEGKVQSVDTTDRSFTLDNGNKIWLADDVAIDSIKEGAEVTVSWEDRGGKPVATSVTPK